MSWVRIKLESIVQERKNLFELMMLNKKWIKRTKNQIKMRQTQWYSKQIVTDFEEQE